MDTKEIVGRIINELANYGTCEQVEIFNEIKNSLLDIRKEVYEKNLSAIRELTEHNEVIQSGNDVIVNSKNLLNKL